MKSAYLLAAVCLAAVPLAANAQPRPRSDSLSRDLVTALLGGTMGSRTIEIHAGLPDDSLPRELFRDAVILGYSDLGYSTMTVAYFPYAPLATMDTMKARLMAAGFKAPNQPAMVERGFVTIVGGRNMFDGLCGPSSIVYPTVSQRTINRTLAVVSRQRSRGPSNPLCDDRDQAALARYPASNTPLPTLPPPPGMSSRGGGSTGSADRDQTMTMQTSLEGDLPVSDIARHYARLFGAEGWRQSDQAVTAALHVSTFEITGADNRRWHCGLVVNVPSRGVAEVHLFLRQLP